jgi:hypothetical protein
MGSWGVEASLMTGSCKWEWVDAVAGKNHGIARATAGALRMTRAFVCSSCGEAADGWACWVRWRMA